MGTKVDDNDYVVEDYNDDDDDFSTTEIYTQFK